MAGYDFVVPAQLTSARLALRRPVAEDAAPLAALLAQAAVAQWWPGYDPARVERELLQPDHDVEAWVVTRQDTVIGFIQAWERADPDARHAGIDLFLGEQWQGAGLGPEAIGLVAGYLRQHRGHHRIVADPAAANERAIRAFARAGFRRAGRLPADEQAPDGSRHDAVLMELVRPPGGVEE